MLFEKYVAKRSDESDVYGFRKLFSQEDDDIHRLDGISLNGPYIDRDEKVKSLIDTARSAPVIIGAAPASGKTSLLALAGLWLEENESAKVIYYYIARDPATYLLLDFKKKTGIEEERTDHLWILIDDAQNAYAFEYEGFWQFAIKAPHGNTHFLIATTYDAHIEGSPVAFRAIAHFNELGLDLKECDQLFTTLSKKGTQNELYFAQWDRYRAELADLSGGHVGVFVQGIRMLQLELKNTPRGSLPSEDDALSMLRTPKFDALLERCYPSKRELNVAQHSSVVKVIMGDVPVDITTSDFAEVLRLQRHGILSGNGVFTCRAAAIYYINCLFPGRASERPKSIEELVIETVKTMSASRLVASKDQGFPKEAVFQQMFFIGLATQLPPNSKVIPEKNTFITDASGKSILSGELDFYINGDLQWALELVRNGNKIGGHVERFHAVTGKYRHVEPKAYLVVDCRGPKTLSVQRMEERCTLYFSDDFRSCKCAMRNNPEVVLQLQE